METVVAGDDIPVDIAPNTEGSRLEAGDMDGTFEPSWKLMKKAKVPYKVVRAIPEQVSIEKHGWQSTISVDRAVGQLRGASPMRDLVRSRQSEGPPHSGQKQPME